MHQRARARSSIPSARSRPPAGRRRRRPACCARRARTRRSRTGTRSPGWIASAPVDARRVDDRVDRQVALGAARRTDADGASRRRARAARWRRRRSRRRRSRCPLSRHARMMRTAISPRLAMSSAPDTSSRVQPGLRFSRNARRPSWPSSRDALARRSRRSSGPTHVLGARRRATVARSAPWPPRSRSRPGRQHLARCAARPRRRARRRHDRVHQADLLRARGARSARRSGTARARRRGRSCASTYGEITAGRMPSFTSVKPNTASSAATTMSQTAARPTPPPSAAPWMRPITGIGSVSSAREHRRQVLAHRGGSRRCE